MPCGSVSDPSEQLTSRLKLNIHPFRGNLFLFSQGVSAPHQSRPCFTGLSARLSTVSSSRFKTRLEQKSKRSRPSRARVGAPSERVRPGSAGGCRASPLPARARLRGGPAHSTTLARSNRLRRPLDALQQRSGHLGPPKFRPPRRQRAPRPPLRVRAPAPERARGAGPRGLGGRERGTRREGRAAGPARRGTWAPAGTAARPLSFHAPGAAAHCAARPGPRAAAAAACRRGEAPRRAPAARPASARGRGGARGRARAPRCTPPRPAPAPNVPPPPVGASARAPAARRLPAVFRWQSCAAPSRGAPRGPPPQRRRRPFRPPRGKAQLAAPLFYLPGVFARALARSLAFPLLALVFFLSFLLFASPRGRFFRSRHPRSPARALLPAGLGGAGRPAALPAPLHPRSGGGGGGGGAPRSDSFQYGTGAGRMRPRPPHPRSSRQPAPLAPRAWRPRAGSPRAGPPRAGPQVFQTRWGRAECEVFGQ